MIILYDCATAPSPRRARIFLAEKSMLHGIVLHSTCRTILFVGQASPS